MFEWLWAEESADTAGMVVDGDDYSKCENDVSLYRIHVLHGTNRRKHDLELELYLGSLKQGS